MPPFITDEKDFVVESDKDLSTCHAPAPGPISKPLDKEEVAVVSDNNQTSSSKSKVRFSDVEFREYERIVGDQTDVLGPPIAIGWAYNESLPIPVADYEDTRIPRRPEWELVLTPNGRRHLLMNEFGFSAQELTTAERMIIERRRSEDVQLVQSLQQPPTKKGGSKNIMKRAGRKFKRALSLDRVADAGSFLAMSSPFASVYAR